MTKRKYWM